MVSNTTNYMEVETLSVSAQNETCRGHFNIIPYPSTCRSCLLGKQTSPRTAHNLSRELHFSGPLGILTLQALLRVVDVEHFCHFHPLNSCLGFTTVAVAPRFGLLAAQTCPTYAGSFYRLTTPTIFHTWSSKLNSDVRRFTTLSRCLPSSQ